MLKIPKTNEKIECFVSQHSNIPTTLHIFQAEDVVLVVEGSDNLGMSLFAALPYLANYDPERFANKDVIAVLNTLEIGYFIDSMFMPCDERELNSRFAKVLVEA
jgi:hypothetical protein